MKRSYLRKFHLKKRNESLKKFKQQKNFCSRLYKKEHNFFCALDINKITGNRNFCKHNQPLYCEKRKFESKITLDDSDDLW